MPGMSNVTPLTPGKPARPRKRASSRGGGGGKRKPTAPPPFYLWLSKQVHHNQERQRAAFEHIRGRWPITEYYNHARVLRILEREGNEHLTGAQLLADEYCEMWGVDEKSQVETIRSAAQQLVPADVDQCDYVDQTGRQCRRDAIPGSDLCSGHGGRWLTAEDIDYVSRTVRDSVVQASLTAMSTITDLMDNARSEKVRLDAAQAVMRYTGADPTARPAGESLVVLTGESTGRSHTDVSGEIARRLELVAERAQLTAAEMLESEVVEGELVPDEDG